MSALVSGSARTSSLNAINVVLLVTIIPIAQMMPDHILFIQCKACAAKYRGCCSDKCCDFIQLPEEEQRPEGKQEVFNGSKFSKNRYKAYKRINWIQYQDLCLPMISRHSKNAAFIWKQQYRYPFKLIKYWWYRTSRHQLNDWNIIFPWIHWPVHCLGKWMLILLHITCVPSLKGCNKKLSILYRIKICWIMNS